MALDITDRGIISELTRLKSKFSSWNITETAGATAYVKFRDSIALATAPTAVDGAAGNSTAGLHYYAMTWVTANGASPAAPGESLLGAYTAAGYTTAGSKIVTVTIPIAPVSTTYSGQALRDFVVGRRLYATKAGAPATATTPTIAQWFLVSADLSTTLAAGMNNLPLDGQTSITVASTTNFAAAGNILVQTGVSGTGTGGTKVVSYTSVDATHFLGCSIPSRFGVGNGGYMVTGGTVTQPHIGENTSTSFNLNLADASFTATNAPTKDTAGYLKEGVKVSAAASVGNTLGGSDRKVENDGGIYVEVNSGTVEWTVSGS